ncbi:MAG: tetratricopeptide repeat protein [Parvularculaceae bacterium]
MADPDLAELQAAAAAFEAGRLEEALSRARSFLARAPGHAEALHLEALALGGLGRIAEAAPAFERAAVVHSNKAAVLGNLGNAFAAAGRLAEAIDAYKRALAIDPAFANGWSGLATALRRDGDLAGAVVAAERAVALDPKNARLRNNLGAVLNAAGRSADAEGAFGEALALQPQYGAALLNRGRLRRERGDLALAMADLDAACASAPGSSEAHHQRANCLRLLSRNGEAEAAYLRAVALAPASAGLHRDLANFYWETGEAGRHLSALDRAIAQTSSPELLDLKAELALMTGDIGGAEAAAGKLIDLVPARPHGFRRLSRVRRAQKRRPEAADLARQAREKAPDDFDALHDYAEALLSNGQYKEAGAALAGDAPRAHLQKHIALKALALRAAGDPAYRVWYDYDRFARKLFIDMPPGYASLEAFNAAVLEALAPLHANNRVRPIDQTLYGGTQSIGRLWNEPHPVIKTLKAALLRAAIRYVGELPDDPSHPFLAQKTSDLDCEGAWSVMLKSGGGHVDHFHPRGWISASYYVRIPPEVSAGEKAGFLRLGASGIEGLDLPAERWIRPEEGSIIVFPSYMWHGVESFEAASPRVTAPFDLAPRIAPNRPWGGPLLTPP